MEPIFVKDIKEILPEVVDWRRHFHQHPEPSYKEYNTTEYLIENIEKLGNVEVSRPMPTGLVARLKGIVPGPTIALRADIDALRMPELTGLGFASENAGVMHACGHDSHTAMLLGVLYVLSKNQASLNGEFVFIFQPAEEEQPGGAIELVKAGVMDGVDVVLGQHIDAMLPVGHIGVRTGPASANSDGFEIVVTGQGGHASAPQLCLDPIPVAVQIVSALQQIISREINPLEAAVLTVTRINGGTANNIIPDTITIGGTVRTYTKDNRDKIYKRIIEIANGISTAGDCSVTVDYTWGYPSVVNTEVYVDNLNALANEIFGEGTATVIDPSMGGEDFAYYLEKVPGCFFHLGVRNEEKGCIYPQHNTKFMLDEDAFEMGITLLINGALRFQYVVDKKRK